MPVLLRFTSPNCTADKYDEIVKRLEQAGAGSPAGRIYHVCWGSSDRVNVSDIWESREAFAKFGETLKPIMEDLGITGETEFIEIHNIIEGAKTASTAV